VPEGCCETQRETEEEKKKKEVTLACRKARLLETGYHKNFEIKVFKKTSFQKVVNQIFLTKLPRGGEKKEQT